MFCVNIEKEFERGDGIVIAVDFKLFRICEHVLETSSMTIHSFHDALFQKLQEMNLDNWENVRGYRPWEKSDETDQRKM